MLENKYNKDIVQAVTSQVINMWDNNVLCENGAESFIGWLEDGEVFANNGMTEEEVDKAMEMANEIAPLVDELTFKFLNVGF